MPLQNRVAPDGEILASPERGLFMGNRGGRFHDAETWTLAPRTRWKSNSWICCVLDFKGRKRKLMQAHSYTELFFLDEVTALAAGHRPCFECRRKDAETFARCWKSSLGGEGRMTAREMDTALHAERSSARPRPIVERNFEDLPDGAVARDGARVVVRRPGRALLWSLRGYAPTETPGGKVVLLTPPGIVDHVLAAGYAPVWHASAEATLR